MFKNKDGSYNIIQLILISLILIISIVITGIYISQNIELPIIKLPSISTQLPTPVPIITPTPVQMINISNNSGYQTNNITLKINDAYIAGGGGGGGSGTNYSYIFTGGGTNYNMNLTLNITTGPNNSKIRDNLTIIANKTYTTDLPSYAVSGEKTAKEYATMALCGEILDDYQNSSMTSIVTQPTIKNINQTLIEIFSNNIITWLMLFITILLILVKLIINHKL